MYDIKCPYVRMLNVEILLELGKLLCAPVDTTQFVTQVPHAVATLVNIIIEPILEIGELLYFEFLISILYQ